MLRIGKLTDYGIVLLAHFAKRAPGATATARELAAATELPFPAVGKVLKALGQAGILHSQRGAKGGYALARPAASIDVAEIIEALEGPIALMECSAGPGHCGQEASCPVRDPWQRIHGTLRETLSRVSLQSLVGVPIAPLVQIVPAPSPPAHASGAPRGEHV